ncbi:MAG: TetR/AcrR family transcriptional regulator [Hyphomicrobiaceae bacterium]|nr:TetR/AcrR family transcriptional regulator [Hyphomicrobiaceae bacterium]
MAKQTADHSAAARLVATAQKEFVSRGTWLGINDVIAAAGVARRSLYNNFTSKSDLVRAAFEAEAAERRAAIDRIQKDCATPRARILALFDLLEGLAVREGFRGCAFINLAVETADPESELHALAKRHKDWISARITGDVVAMGRKKALAEQIRLLWDGAIVGAYVQGSMGPIRAARAAAGVLLDA